MRKLKKHIAITLIVLSMIVLLLDFDSLLLKLSTAFISMFVIVWSTMWFVILDATPKKRKRKPKGISPFIGRVPKKIQ